MKELINRWIVDDRRLCHLLSASIKTGLVFWLLKERMFEFCHLSERARWGLGSFRLSWCLLLCKMRSNREASLGETARFLCRFNRFLLLANGWFHKRLRPVKYWLWGSWVRFFLFHLLSRTTLGRSMNERFLSINWFLGLCAYSCEASCNLFYFLILCQHTTSRLKANDYINFN
jgi:hypothetical protein